MFGTTGGMGTMFPFGLLLLVGLVLLIVVAVRVIGGGIRRDDSPVRGGSGRTGERSPARQRLDERYASGELTTEEYRERVRELGESA